MKKFLYDIAPPGQRSSNGTVKANSVRQAKAKIRKRRKLKNLRGLKMLVCLRPWKVYISKG